MRSRIEPMKKIARSLRTHRELILNYFRAQKLLSSGGVEGVNNKAKVTMRKSYGFRTYRVLELALYHLLGKLPRARVYPRFLLTNQKTFGVACKTNYRAFFSGLPRRSLPFLASFSCRARSFSGWAE